MAPAGKIILKKRSPEEAQKIVDDFALNNWRKMAREPQGELRHPYLVPGSVYQDLWDWDAFFTSCIVPAEGLKYATVVSGILRTF